MAADSRGALRGRCKDCSCSGYIPPETGFKCSTCQHPPGKHELLDRPVADSSLPSGALYSNAVQGSVSSSPSLQAKEPKHRKMDNSSQPMTLSSSRATSHHDKESKKPTCKMEGCFRTAFYDQHLGYFDYCSPACRDKDLLGSSRKKLEEDIRKQQKEISEGVSGSGTRKKVILTRKATGDELGIIVSKAKGKSGLLVTGVVVGSCAFSTFEKEELKLLSRILRINGKEVTSGVALGDFAGTNIELLVDTSNGLEFNFLHECSEATHIVALRYGNREGECGMEFEPSPTEGIVAKNVQNDKVPFNHGVEKNDSIIMIWRGGAEKPEATSGMDPSRALALLSEAEVNNNTVVLFIRRKC